METKHNNYGNVRRVKVSLPQWVRPGRHQATITRLRALAEIPRPLVDPVVRVGERVLRRTSIRCYEPPSNAARADRGGRHGPRAAGTVRLWSSSRILAWCL